MRCTRYQPCARPSAWGPLETLQQEFSKAFGAWPFQSLSSLFTEGSAFPPLNLWEDEGHLYVEAELPGLEMSDVEVSLAEGNSLTLKATRKQPELAEGRWHKQERWLGEVSRTVTLPHLVESEQAQAKFEHGVLTITLPKHASVQARKIPIQA